MQQLGKAQQPFGVHQIQEVINMASKAAVRLKQIISMEELARVADKATTYTMEFRRLRNKHCPHYGMCPEWHSKGCLHKDKVGFKGTAGVCDAQLCPLKNTV